MMMACFPAVGVTAAQHHENVEQGAEQNHAENKGVTGWDAEEEDGSQEADGDQAAEQHEP
jgi:hypothetical protein